MEKKILIIQRTWNGLDTDYSSVSLTPVLEKALHEERSDSLKLSNNSDYYCISYINSFKVYSLIKATGDRAGRNGFVAVRLFSKSNVNITNAVEIMQNVLEKNEKYFSEKVGQQDYEEILAATTFEISKNEYVATEASKENIYLSVAKTPHEINSLLNNPKTVASKRSYIYTDDRALTNEENLRLLKFNRFDQVNNLNEVEITNNSNLLDYIKVNGKEINARSGKLLYNSDDSIVYKRSDEKKERQFNGRFDLAEKYVPPKVRYPESERSDSKGSFLPLIFGGLVGLILGGVGGYFIPKLFAEEQKEIPQEYSPIVTSSVFFKVDEKLKDPVFVVDKNDSYSNLVGKKFKFDSDNKEWMYQENDGSSYKPLGRNRFFDLLSPSADSTAYINALEQVSGRQLLNSTKSVNASEEKNEGGNPNDSNIQTAGKDAGATQVTTPSEPPTENKTIKPTNPKNPKEAAAKKQSAAKSAGSPAKSSTNTPASRDKTKSAANNEADKKMNPTF